MTLSASFGVIAASFKGRDDCAPLDVFAAELRLEGGITRHDASPKMNHRHFCTS